MYLINESSLVDLYQSAVTAFPNTSKRQHSTDTIKVSHLKWIPFLGMKTLFIQGLAQNEGREYNPIVLFKNVAYHDKPSFNVRELNASDGGRYFMERLSFNKNDVLVRCGCGDFKWRFKYYNHLEHSLFGQKGKKYLAKGVQPPANPLQMEGICKHLMKMMKVLDQSGLIAWN